MFLFPLFYVIREFHRFLHRGKAPFLLSVFSVLEAINARSTEPPKIEPPHSRLQSSFDHDWREVRSVSTGVENAAILNHARGPRVPQATNLVPRVFSLE